MARTHKLLSREICKKLNEELNFDLDIKSVKYGCIKPDYVPELISIPHYKDKSFAYISNKIKKLEQVEVPKSKLEKANYFDNLGVVLHFIMDYFCYAHNDDNYNWMPLHCLYEIKLSSMAKQMDIPSICNKSINSLNLGIKLEEAWFEYYINDKLAEYKSKSISMNTDIETSIEVCIGVIYRLITKCQGKSNKTAA